VQPHVRDAFTVNDDVALGSLDEPEKGDSQRTLARTSTANDADLNVRLYKINITEALTFVKFFNCSNLLEGSYPNYGLNKLPQISHIVCYICTCITYLAYISPSPRL